ncbi:MAG TPA: VWA domain-containing protein, partial [Verrucomicrobiae bacterium]
MNFTFTNPLWLLALPPALAWMFWLAWKSDASLTRARRWVAFAIRIVVVLAVVLALAGIRWMRPQEGMNVVFLLDRSDSVPSPQQEAAREFVNRSATKKKPTDQAGVVVFGTEAAIEASVRTLVAVPKIEAVVPTERTDLASAIRLGAAALPE